MSIEHIKIERGTHSIPGNVDHADVKAGECGVSDGQKADEDL